MDVRLFAFLAGRPSVAIQPREQFCGLPKRALALLLANVMFWQSLWAQADGIAVSRPGTSLGQAGNGVPIVNIAAPNGSGLSHNQFSDYNVGREGLILNNATGRTQSTQLGGIILGNPNLQGRAVSTILNEVTGSNPSHLRGFTEVAGQGARVIVANPHGITCNGCGFINTPRVTLSTGKPILDGNGQVRSYQVDGGAIAIEGTGLDARNVDRFELITRSAKVNAKLHAKQLDIVTGRNDVDANTLKATARASDGSAAPSLAIDRTALGGMYAGAIRLVGTEKGVGVRLAGDMAVDAGDLDIDASGKLTLANASAGQDVKLNADEVELTGSTYAGRNASVNSSGDVQVRQSLAARQHVKVDGAQVRNQGVIEAGVEPDKRRNDNADLTLTSTGLVNSGQIVASRDLAVTVSDTLDNRGGRLQATAAGVDITAASIDNQGGVVVGQQAVKATVSNGTLDNRAGQLLGSRLELVADTVDNRMDGKVLAGSEGLLIKAATVRNQQGKLLAGGSLAELLLGAGRLDNQQGSLTASAITLVAGDADNSGGTLASLAGNQQLTVQRLINQNGLIEASQAIELDGQTLDNSQNGRVIAHAGDKTRIELGGELDNRGGRIASASTDLEVKAASLLNQGGTLEHVAQGNLLMRAASLSGSQGTVSGLGSGTWTLGSVDGVGTWHTNAGLDISGLQHLTLNNGERIASAGDLRLAGGQLTNAGELVSDGKLTLETTGDLINQGLFSSLKAMSISGNNLTQDGGRIASKEAMTLTLDGTLSNRGRLTSSQTLDITAASIDNQGTLGAQGKTTLHARGAINNQQDSLLFAGGPLELRGVSLLNHYGDIYSKGDLSFAALDGGKAASLRNLSGSIESEGNIDIKVDYLENAKAKFVHGETIADRFIRINCTDCSGGRHTGTYIVTTTYKGTVASDSPAARLLANRDLTLEATTVDNRQSLLAANGNLTAEAQNFYNRGLTLDNRIEEISHWLPGVSQSAYRVTEAATHAWNAQYAGLPIEQQAPLPTEVTQYPVSSRISQVLPGTDTAYAGSIQAGGKLALNVSSELANGTLDAHSHTQLTGKTLDSAATGAGDIQITLGTQSGDPGLPTDVKRVETLAADGSTQVSFVPVDFSGTPFVGVDPTALPSFRLPQGEYGLFVRNQNPTASYLIETNPELTDLGRFMASDYLLGHLGFDPDQAWRRLGDGRYETRLVADAVRAQTGQRFLADGLSSDYEQFKYLMDNAVASKDALGLAVGVRLSEEQVAALSHDIVWMETREVEGEQVLAPVLYLAKVDSRNLRGGSLVQGRDLQLVTGHDLKNVGTLRASNDLSAVAGGSLYQGGLAQANEHLAMLARDSLRNALAGEIRGKQVSLVSLKGDILNDRTATEVAVGSGSLTRVDTGSMISARGGLTMNAARDLTNKGRISSGGDLTAQAGGDINLLAVQDHNVTREALRRGLRTEETLINLGSSLEAAGNVTLKAGGNLNVVASSANAGKNLDASAEGDINVVAGEDVHNVESRYKKGGKKVHEIAEHSRQVAASLTAGEDLEIRAGHDVNLIASKLKAGDEAYLYAGNDLNLVAGQEREHTLYDMEKKGSWGSKQTRRDEVTQITHVGTEITSGGDLTLESGRDQLYQVAKLDSGKDINLISGGAITFEGVKDLHEQSHTKSSNNAFWISAKGKGSTDETLHQTQMRAAGAITIKAVEGLRIDLRQVDQQTVSQAIDAMVAADPQLAWIKAAQQRGDVDWRLVREVHESFKYDTSGLGPASQLIIAIALAAVMGPMMAGMGTMVQAGAISVATKATVSTIDNRGNLGAVFKDVTSTDSIKGYAVSVATAGAAQSLGYDPGAMGFNAASLKTVMLKAAADATIKTAVYGGSFKDNLGSALLNTAASAGGAVAAGKIGDLGWVDGSLDKVLLHAALGGLMAEVMGSDFRTGAIAGGANEVLVGLLGDRLLPANLTPGTPEHVQAQANLVALSKIVGVLGAAATKGDLDVAAQVAENGTRYNLLGDHSAKLRDEAREKFSQTGDLKAARELVRLEGADQRSDELRAAYLRDPSSLSQKELAEFTAYLQVYAYERLKAVGPEKAQASLTSLLAGDQVFGYGYPYAGSKEQKLLWADAQRSQLGLLGSLWPHERSVDERTYLDAKHALRIGQELQGMASLGDPAIYFLGGSIGSAIRAAAATNGALQATQGAKQAFEGDKWNAAGNMVFGLLGVGTLGVKNGVNTVFKGDSGAITPSYPTPSELIQRPGLSFSRVTGRSDHVIDIRASASEGRVKGVDKLFEAGRTPKASELRQYAENKGWKPSQTDGGPLKYVDENGVPRVTIKQGSSRAPGSADPHVEFKDATGKRIDAFGNPVTRKSPGNHTSIDFDL